MPENRSWVSAFSSAENESWIFFEKNTVFGLTSMRYGCILYDVGLEKGRCSPQSRICGESIPRDTGRAGPKKNRKIFGKRFDKAQKCAIVNITV
jgi:hypothetical protein